MYGYWRSATGRLAAVHPFHRRVVALVVTVSASLPLACTNGADGPTPDGGSGTAEETLVPPDETLPGGKVTPEFVANRIVQAVIGGVGLVFPDEAETCVSDALLRTVSNDDLAIFGVDGVVEEMAPPVQDAIFAAFDGCISGDLMATIGASTLINSGATVQQADCFYKLSRQRLGFAGMYRYGAVGLGQAEPNAVLSAALDDVYADCGLDPAALTPPTLPPDTVPPSTTLIGATTTHAVPTSPGETTTTVPLTITTGPPVTLVPPTALPDPSSTTLFPVRSTPATSTNAATTTGATTTAA
jgi:hypothetical protein